MNLDHRIPAKMPAIREQKVEICLVVESFLYLEILFCQIFSLHNYELGKGERGGERQRERISRVCIIYMCVLLISVLLDSWTVTATICIVFGIYNISIKLFETKGNQELRLKVSSSVATSCIFISLSISSNACYFFYSWYNVLCVIWLQLYMPQSLSLALF